MEIVFPMDVSSTSGTVMESKSKHKLGQKRLPSPLCAILLGLFLQRGGGMFSSFWGSAAPSIQIVACPSTKAN
jgi:hypothetical protein